MINMLTRLFSPKEIILKKGAITRLRFLTGEKALIFYGSESLQKAGHLQKIQSLLEAAKLQTVLAGDIQKDPTKTRVEACAKILANFKPDWVIACGGGAVIDTAKLAWIFYENPQLSWETIQKPFSIAKTQKKSQLIAIPTTSGTGSEVSLTAVVKDEAQGKKIPIVSPELLPDMVILDPNLTLELPSGITVYTALDAFTHAFEAFCSKLHTHLTDQYAIAAGRLIVASIWQALEAPQDIEAREKLLYAAMLAGQAQNVSSVGAVHAISHTLGANFDLPHGLINAFFLPAIATLNAESSERPLLFIQEVGLGSLENLATWVKKLLVFSSLPLQWQELVDKPPDINYPSLAQKALEDVCMRTNPAMISVEKLIAILTESY